GLILYYDTCNWIYAYLTWNEEQRSRTLRILRCDFKDFCYGSEEVLLPNTGAVCLRCEVQGAQAQFLYRSEGASSFLPLGTLQPADHLSDDYIETRRGRCAFSGAMVGICAQDMDAHASFADFKYFHYQEA
ncbi:MAG: hypothetical protein ACI4LE_09690, partial [Faecalibacterium sp.]